MSLSRSLKLAGLGVALVGAYLGYQIVYATPMAEAKQRLASAEDRLNELDNKIRDGRSIKKDLQSIASKTLGKAEDSVSHQFSACLRQLAERSGLSRVVVTHRDPEKQPNPLTKATGIRPESVKKILRGRPDFELMRGTVTGQGSLEQVMRAMAEVDAQPWCKIDSFTLTPAAGGEKFTIELGVSSPLLADLLTTEPKEILLPTATEGAGFVVAAITSRNVFVDPKKPPAADQPPVVVAADPPKPPSDSTPANPPLPPPPPPYADWRLTGVVVSRVTGVQAFLSNTRTNSKLTVLRGAKVEDAVLVDASGEIAIFEIAGAKFRVRINQTLAEREPAG